MVKWQPYIERAGWSGHSVAGDLRIAEGIYSPQLNNKRDIVVYLPPSYGTPSYGTPSYGTPSYGTPFHQTDSDRYPVIYMHDGQNLFDEGTSFAGAWHVGETMQKLSHEGLEAIIVGIPNMGADRLAEYSPFRDRQQRGGRGDLYLAFIVDTLKPLIDRDFRTLPGRMNSGIAGSSMGGLISLYAFFRYPEVFGMAGVMSPSLWFAREAIMNFVGRARYWPGRIYLDAGTREHTGSGSDYPVWRARSRRYYGSVRHLKRILVRKGYRLFDELLHVEEKWAAHQEAAWARRLPRALRFLLGAQKRESYDAKDF
jgi:predicted alpha/beta superfamily hydrolase